MFSRPHHRPQALHRPGRVALPWSAAGVAWGLGLVVAWVVALVLGLWLAATAAAQAPDAAARRALLAQKVRLVEQMLAAPRLQALAAQEGDAGTAAREALARARGLLESSRSAVDAGAIAEGEAAANEALRLVSAASSSSRAAQGRDEAQQRERNEQTETELQVYRSALAETAARAPQTGSPQRAEAIGRSIAQVERLMAEYEAHKAAGRHVQAREPLGHAYQEVVAALNKARAGETVTIALHFATPADELDYEQRRHRDHVDLLATAQRERPPVPAVALLIERSRAQAEQARQRAAEQAGTGELKAAIGLLEEATDHLLRALQLLGVPVTRPPLTPP